MENAMDATSHLCQLLLSFLAAMAVAITTAMSSAVALDIESDDLSRVHQSAAARYANVRQISATEFNSLRNSQRNDILILDVREKPEYAVSRIKGSVQITPGVREEDFLQKFGSLVKGRTVIVYCSVGVRSMKLAARLQQALKTAGAGEIYNLAGGVFNWHNQSRKLADSEGPTELIHPYNWYWSRLVERRHLISYKAEKSGW